MSYEESLEFFNLSSLVNRRLYLSYVLFIALFIIPSHSVSLVFGSSSRTNHAMSYRIPFACTTFFATFFYAHCYSSVEPLTN